MNAVRAELVEAHRFDKLSANGRTDKACRIRSFIFDRSRAPAWERRPRRSSVAPLEHRKNSSRTYAKLPRQVARMRRNLIRGWLRPIAACPGLASGRRVLPCWNTFV